MKLITLKGLGKTSRIMANASVDTLPDLCKGRKVVVITDDNVQVLYGEQFDPYIVLAVRPGEGSKTLETASRLYEALLESEVDRSWFIVGFGGGVVCDIAGFTASTYLRGLSFGFVPTTLLAQVDAAIGGKNGVNLKGYKNLVGTFSQPEFVLCDPTVLRTLPDIELRNGYAEVAKHAVIGDRLLFDLMERRGCKASLLHGALIEEVIYRSLKVKTDIVSRDEKEKGERRKLNFGHTIGHALEKTTGLTHGEAVSVGMVVEAGLSERRGTLDGTDRKRIVNLLADIGLPVQAKGSKGPIMDAIMKDKKREASKIHSVLLEGIGRARVEEVEIAEIEEVVDDLC